MGRPLPLLLLPLALCALLPSGAAIRCYQCTSLEDRGCDDPFAGGDQHAAQCSPTRVQEAARALGEVASRTSELLKNFGIDVPESTPEYGFVCQKAVFTDSQDRKLVARSCSIRQDVMNTCPTGRGPECLQCDTDLCNAAAGPALPLALLLLLLPAPLLALLRP